MVEQTKIAYDQATADAVEKAFSAPRKNLPSWLFYDEAGDRIFQQIMLMPAYYPTRCEYDILQLHKEKLLKLFKGNSRSFKLFELGAGDGLKTEVLLKYFLTHHPNFTYLPVDISANALDQLSQRLKSQLPELRVEPINKNYHAALASLREHEERKIVLFMGANIGNFTLPEAAQFLKKLVLPLSAKDLLLIGFDLKKDPRIILEAYDDPAGLTASFNLNILHRINRELGGHFDVNQFIHFPHYDPETGTTESFIISMKDQTVHIDALGRAFHFHRWESIQTEVSQKYDLHMIEKLMALTGLKVVDVLYDNDKYFCDVLAKPF